MIVTYIDHETIRIDGIDHPTRIAKGIISGAGLPVCEILEEAYTASLS